MKLTTDMWIVKSILALVYAAAVCHAWVIQPALEAANAQEASVVNNVPVAQVLFGDDSQLFNKRMGEILQSSESRQTSQQQRIVNDGMNEEFLPFLKALASQSSNADPVYYQQKQQDAAKQDRQGYYGGHGGHSYDGGLNKHISLGVPSVGIKIDPFGILKALISLIPRPKLNLNGKLFFGVELGKKASIDKTSTHHHHPY